MDVDAIFEAQRDYLLSAHAPTRSKRQARLESKLVKAIDRFERVEAELSRAFNRWQKARAEIKRISNTLDKIAAETE